MLWPQFRIPAPPPLSTCSLLGAPIFAGHRRAAVHRVGTDLYLESAAAAVWIPIVWRQVASAWSLLPGSRYVQVRACHRQIQAPVLQLVAIRLQIQSVPSINYRSAKLDISFWSTSTSYMDQRTEGTFPFHGSWLLACLGSVGLVSTWCIRRTCRNNTSYFYLLVAHSHLVSWRNTLWIFSLAARTRLSKYRLDLLCYMFVQYD
jgi:hypothetical protein